MWVTCYTDASFGPGKPGPEEPAARKNSRKKKAGKKQGAWAVWLRCSEGRLVRRGLCPPYVRDSTSAELAALFAGVHLAVSTWGPRVVGVSLRSDCQGALALASSEARLSRKPAIRTLQEKLHALVRAENLELELRWVPGHQPLTRGAAAYLNRQCDRLARAARVSSPSKPG